MLTEIHPKLPMRDKKATRNFYVSLLGFEELGTVDYPDYLMIRKDGIQLHFFLFKELIPEENYGQVYIRTSEIDKLYGFMVSKGIRCSKIEDKPWSQREFSTWDPDTNLLTFGQSLI